LCVSGRGLLKEEIKEEILRLMVSSL